MTNVVAIVMISAVAGVGLVLGLVGLCLVTRGKGHTYIENGARVRE